ncbi:MAG TPA: hypothetical protein ENG45_01105, partial [Candidatus Aenigmarchaeota archaeon]|nr:hypothetical protein [Candidatus Aenigmarchaeota archaeon]
MIKDIPNSTFKEYVLTYFTPSPTKKEEIIFDKGWKKIITVSAPLHYTNVKVRTKIPEGIEDFGLELNTTNYTLIDTDGNGLPDTVEWTIPSLSTVVQVISASPCTWMESQEFGWILNCYVQNPEIFVKSDDQGISIAFSPEKLNASNPRNLNWTLSSVFKRFLKKSKECLSWREEILPAKFLQVEEIKPGVYRLKLNLKDSYKLSIYKISLTNGIQTKEVYLKQGLIVVDSERDRYYPGETVKLLFAVVDDKGEPVSNADIRLTIETPSGKHYYLSTQDGSIKEGRIGTYYAYFNQTFEEGNYSLFAVATGNDTNNYIYSNFLVEKNISFQFIRKTPIRIDPLLPPFFSTLKIISFENVSNFTLQEIVPKEFEILNVENVEETEENKVITWYGLRNESSVNYSFKVPIKYPYLYEIKARILYGNEVYDEARSWLLLTDPPAADEACIWWEEVFTGHASTQDTNGERSYSWSPSYSCREDTVNCYINEVWFHAWASVGSQSGVSGGIFYESISDGSTTLYPWCRNLGRGQECEAYTCVSGGTNRISGATCGGSTCDTGTYPGACDVSAGTYTEDDSFTIVFHTSGNGGGISGYRINYTWCGKDTRPHFKDPQVSPQSAGWGVTRTFTVKVYDKQGDNVKVYLWHRP